MFKYGVMLLATAAVLVFSPAAMAEKKCLPHQSAVVCPKEPNGGIAVTSSGQIKCGPGACLIDRSGRVICSGVPGGGAGFNAAGTPKCEGGCQNGEDTFCLTLR
ncbi:MAG: hypothetical protein LBJ64_06350 [Deltaproteobacteria bacterium]|jgi:hypothetical protein|nr:hypothetical protein [Deltaproteobacteria bacterium]